VGMAGMVKGERKEGTAAIRITPITRLVL